MVVLYAHFLIPSLEFKKTFRELQKCCSKNLTIVRSCFIYKSHANPFWTWWNSSSYVLNKFCLNFYCGDLYVTF